MASSALGRLSVSEYLEANHERPQFRIAKRGRLVLRALELGVAICQFIAFSNVNTAALTSIISNPGIATLVWITIIIGFVFAIKATALYIFPLVFKWKVQTVLIWESVMDLTMIVLSIVTAAMMITAGSCPGGTTICNKYNVTLGTMFFSLLFFGISFIFDIQGLVVIKKKY